ncbi:hypothetical protein WA026_010254 [Henosepilachna vigintioctopunctata]|uniref:Uncharacterized protein n=1 Tax=Henosepilachna vigintioctopunctata TaxID=420089 RepID=A0AAW1UJY2_9CUCU
MQAHEAVINTFPLLYYIGALPKPCCRFVLFLVLVKKVLRDVKRCRMCSRELILATSMGGITEALLFPVLWFMEYLPGQARYILAACLFLKMIGDVWAFQRKQRGR